MSTTTHQQVTVNLNVNIDASGNIDVFGESTPTIPNNTTIVALCELPTACLYLENSHSLFEFWEPSNNLGTFTADLAGRDGSAASEGRDYTKLLGTLTYYLNHLLNNPFDCSGAVPFNDNKYSGVVDYTTQPDFGRLALSTYAHYLFGHIGATSAITNDTAVMEAMLKYPENGVSTQQTPYNSSDSFWTEHSELNANLACRLVNAIVSKSSGNTDDNNVSDTICGIVKQVLGQDASRAMDQDNNALEPDVRQGLRFIDGDTIYMTITLKKPNVNVSLGQQVADTIIEDKFSQDVTFNLKITLRDVIKSITPIGWSSDVNTFKATNTTANTTQNAYEIQLTLGQVSTYLKSAFIDSTNTSNIIFYKNENTSLFYATFIENQDGTVNISNIIDSSENTVITCYIPFFNNFTIENERIYIIAADNNIDASIITPYSIVVPVIDGGSGNGVYGAASSTSYDSVSKTFTITYPSADYVNNIEGIFIDYGLGFGEFLTVNNGFTVNGANVIFDLSSTSGDITTINADVNFVGAPANPYSESWTSV